MASNDIEYKQNQNKGNIIVSNLTGALRYFYNPSNGQICGRTARDCGLLFGFYIIFYSLLFGFFAITMAIFHTTIDRNYPRLIGDASLLKGNPGMGFRPMPHLESTLIRFKQGEADSYKRYTDHIKAFLQDYEKENQVGENLIDCSLGKPADSRMSTCLFDIDEMLGNECTHQQEYGYFDGEPCVLLKLNKIYGWEPEPLIQNGTRYNQGISLIGDAYSSDNIIITCEGENKADRQNMGPIEFYPKKGMPFYYYPFLNQQDYRQPVVFVKFRKPVSGVLIMVWCKAWAENIYHHRLDRAGSTHFELLID